MIPYLTKIFGIWLNPFSDKGEPANSDISLVQNVTVITNDQELTEICNDHYVNLVEKASGEKPSSIAKDTGTSDDCKVVRLILDKYKYNPGVLAITQNQEHRSQQSQPYCIP